MEIYELSPETAHPTAQRVLNEDFYWSSIEESAPFGSDDGADAFYGFREWRMQNPDSDPLGFLKSLIDSWDYPPFDWNEMDEEKIGEYISTTVQIDESEFEKNIPVMLENFKKIGSATGKEIDEAKLREIMSATSGTMGGNFLLEQDNATIAIGFGQFVMEGRTDTHIKELTRTALQRQLLPVLLNVWDEDYIPVRKEQLEKMLAVLATF